MLSRRTALRPLPKLRRMVSAGEPLDPETIAAFREATGLEPADGYGQTETGQVTANLVGEPVRPGSMGKPLPGIKTRIVEGELQLRAASSPTFFSRYLDGERFEGEWWHTGDLVRDEDGHLFFEGRGDDIILSAGYRIGPTEVESALLSHPAVADAAAVAAPDPERGAVVRAIVVLRKGGTSDGELARELQEHCKRETAPYKFPRIVEFASELPKTSSGKIKRAQLRAEPR
jgi:acetyl-CoA synthetase